MNILNSFNFQNKMLIRQTLIQWYHNILYPRVMTSSPRKTFLERGTERKNNFRPNQKIIFLTISSNNDEKSAPKQDLHSIDRYSHIKTIFFLEKMF